MDPPGDDGSVSLATILADEFFREVMRVQHDGCRIFDGFDTVTKLQFWQCKPTAFDDEVSSLLLSLYLVLLGVHLLLFKTCPPAGFGCGRDHSSAALRWRRQGE